MDDGYKDGVADDSINPLELVTCTRINTEFSGELVELKNSEATVKFIPNSYMRINDNNNIIHSGFMFGSAAYCAMCAINQPYSVIISSEVKFLVPVELGHEVIFKAVAMSHGFKKNEVRVEGTLLSIKIFDGIFHIAVFDKPMFKIKLDKGEKK